MQLSLLKIKPLNPVLTYYLVRFHCYFLVNEQKILLFCIFSLVPCPNISLPVPSFTHWVTSQHKLTVMINIRFLTFSKTKSIIKTSDSRLYILVEIFNCWISSVWENVDKIILCWSAEMCAFVINCSVFFVVSMIQM